MLAKTASQKGNFMQKLNKIVAFRCAIAIGSKIVGAAYVNR
jgi:hypothetical protein